jgi:polar amino acid transport system substrate-binding protein
MKKPPLALLSVLALALVVALLAGCGGSSGSSSSEAATAPASGGETGAGGETADAAACTPANMETKSPGVLTVATDKPAYPPYFEDDDPTNGEGFESAVAFAIGKQLGYSKEDVKWTVEPFDSSYAPGEKNFDFDVNEISITPAREKAVDFSAPYYTANQAIVVLKSSDAAGAESLEELQGLNIGVQVGTTSLEAVEEVIQPDSKPEVFNSSNDVITALKNEQIDAVVVDLPTALYLTAVQVPAATVAGQFEAPGGDQWGALLAKGSPLTGCVSEAIEELESSGELEAINKRWMSQAVAAPVLR